MTFFADKEFAVSISYLRYFSFQVNISWSLCRIIMIVSISYLRYFSFQVVIDCAFAPVYQSFNLILEILFFSSRGQLDYNDLLNSFNLILEILFFSRVWVWVLTWCWTLVSISYLRYFSFQVKSMFHPLTCELWSFNLILEILFFSRCPHLKSSKLEMIYCFNLILEILFFSSSVGLGGILMRAHEVSISYLRYFSFQVQPQPTDRSGHSCFNLILEILFLRVLTK